MEKLTNSYLKLYYEPFATFFGVLRATFFFSTAIGFVVLVALGDTLIDIIITLALFFPVVTGIDRMLSLGIGFLAIKFPNTIEVENGRVFIPKFFSKKKRYFECDEIYKTESIFNLWTKIYFMNGKDMTIWLPNFEQPQFRDEFLETISSMAPKYQQAFPWRFNEQKSLRIKKDSND